MKGSDAVILVIAFVALVFALPYVIKTIGQMYNPPPAGGVSFGFNYPIY